MNLDFRGLGKWNFCDDFLGLETYELWCYSVGRSHAASAAAIVQEEHQEAMVAVSSIKEASAVGVI